MPLELIPEERSEIIRLHYQGYTNEEISKKTGKSTGAISKVITNHQKNSSEGKSDDVISFVRNLKKNNISIGDASDGSRLYLRLKKMNLHQDKFGQFLELFDKISHQTEDPQSLLEYSQKLFALQSQTDIQLEKIPEHFSNSLNRQKELQSEISSLEQKLKDLKSQLNDNLNKNNITIEKLDDYNLTKESLNVAGLDMDNWKDFAKMIQSAKSKGFDIELIQDHLIKEHTHEKRVHQLKNKIESLETQEQQNQKSIDSQDEKIKSNSKLIDTISKFTSLGISSNSLEQMYIEVLHIAKKNKISHLEALEKFYYEIANFDKQLGFEKKLIALDQNISALTQQQSELRTKIKQESTKVNSLRSEKIKLESQIDTIQTESLKILENHNKKLTETLTQQREETQKTFSNFRLMLLEVLAYYANKDGKMLSSSMELFGKHLAKIIESNEQLGNIHSIRVINELLEGNGKRHEVEQVVSSILTAFFEYSKKENIAIYQEYTKKLVNVILLRS